MGLRPSCQARYKRVVRAEAAPDHYAVLGIAREVTVAEIRRAYRLLALRHHPDRAGPDATPLFQRITQAYHVLSDPAARAAYDARLRASAPRGAAAPAAKMPDVIARLAGPLEALVARAAARRGPDGLIELVLTRTEARQGGTAALGMPLDVPCPTCGGCAQPGTLWCVRCEFQGTVREDVTVCIGIPPLVADGATFTVHVDPNGAAPLRVRVCIGR